MVNGFEAHFDKQQPVDVAQLAFVAKRSALESTVTKISYVRLVLGRGMEMVEP